MPPPSVDPMKEMKEVLRKRAVAIEEKHKEEPNKDAKEAGNEPTLPKVVAAKEIKDVLRKKASHETETLSNDGAQTGRNPTQGRSVSLLTPECSASQEIREALRKRATALESYDSRSEVPGSGEKPSQQHPSDVSEEQEVFVETKMHRKGSKVYKNHGWKYSRSESCSSTSSSQSFIIKEEKIKTNDQETRTELVDTKSDQEIFGEKNALTPDQQKALLEEKYQDIIDLLASVGVEIDNSM